MAKARTSLNGAMNTTDVLVEMSGGNPGALNVLMAVLQSEEGSIMDLLHMDDMNMRGSQIWVGYKDFCKEDLGRFIGAVRSRDPDMVEYINTEMRSSDAPVVAAGASYRR